MKKLSFLLLLTMAANYAVAQGWMKITCNSTDVKGIPFQKVRIKKSDSPGLTFLFAKDHYVYFSEKPDGIEKGYYAAHSVNGFIADGNKKNKIEIGDSRMKRTDGGWYEYDFGKTLYIRKVGLFVDDKDHFLPIYILPFNDNVETTTTTTTNTTNNVAVNGENVTTEEKRIIDEKSVKEEKSPQDTEKQRQTEQFIKTRKEADAAYAKLETVKDLSGFASSPNIIAEAKKLTVGGDYIKGNFRFKVPIRGLLIEGSSSDVNAQSSAVTIEVMDFGNEGKTVLFTLEVPDLNTAGTFSLSGKNVNIGPGQSKSKDEDWFSLMKGTTPWAFLSKFDGSWVGGIVKVVNGLVSDFHRGMTRSEVEAKCGKLGLSKFKETGKTTKYTICSLFWVDMQKRYDIYGNYDYQMRNDKKYGDFYFDNQGRLMKWFLYL